MSYNFVADNINTRNFVADFLQVKCNFRRKMASLLLWDYGQHTLFMLGSLESA